MYTYSMRRQIIVIAHNIRSCHNIGSLFRTAEGLGIEKLFLTGYTPYPKKPDDERLPHLASKIENQIDKTALGSQKTLSWEYVEDIAKLLTKLKKQEYKVVALEQTKSSQRLPDYRPPAKIALILGNEVKGIDSSVLKLADKHLEIPMFGQKESFNVVQAAAMALYVCRFSSE